MPDGVQINGIAHVQLSVNDFAACKRFYSRLLPFLGLSALIDTDDFYYCIGARTGVAISRADEQHKGTAFDQRRAGLHHVCFRARSSEDVDAIHALAVELGANVVHAPEEGGFAPGYYSVLFEDPDGIRLEANFVPGKGHFGPKGQLGAPSA